MSIIPLLARPRLAVVSLVLIVAILAAVNGLDFPLSNPYMARIIGHHYLDLCAFFSGPDVLATLEGLGERGRLLQALLLSTIDIVLPAIAFLAGASVIATLRHGADDGLTRLLFALPAAAYLLDLTENGIIVALLLQHPAADRSLAAAEGVVSGVKFCAYVASVLAMVALGLGALVRRRGARL